jgi:hypothetical protein
MVAPAPTVASISVLSGPIVLRAPIRVAPWRLVKGAITTSRSSSTPASIVVAAGLTIVAPASM